MAKVDAELFLSRIEALLKADLNSKIEAITTEKGDSLELQPIQSEAFFFQTLGERAVNYNPFVLYAIVDGQDEGMGPMTRENWVAEVVILVVDGGQDGAIGKRILRYRRALKEVFQDNWDKIGFGLKLRVKSLSPVSLQLANSDETYKMVGVQIEADMS
jgi:hypothetical protein